jgi:hypothetical protein
MYDLLTPEEDSTAAERGWKLSYVYDMRPNRWIVMVVPPAAAQSVLDQAHRMCPLSLKAIRLAMQPVIRKPQHDRKPSTKKNA